MPGGGSAGGALGVGSGGGGGFAGHVDGALVAGTGSAATVLRASSVDNDAAKETSVARFEGLIEGAGYSDASRRPESTPDRRSEAA